MRVLLIGGTGHIGNLLAAHFMKRGDEVVAISRGELTPAGHHWNKVRRVAVDRKRAQLEPHADCGTAWQHCIGQIAAEVVIDLIAYDREDTRQTLEAAMPAARQFINIGTGWRFGETRTLPTRETDPVQPRSSYGEHKQAMWDMIREAHRDFGLAGTQFDPPAIQGPPKVPNTPCGLRLLDFHQEIADSRAVTIPGTGETILGMVHVRDVAQAVILAVEQPEKAAGEIFNVAADEGITYNGLFHFLREYFGSYSTEMHMPLDEFERQYPERTSRHHVLYHQLLANDKIKRVLGFRPTANIYESLVESLDWHSNSGSLRRRS